MIQVIKKHITSPVSPAPLAVFRVLFGFIMLVSIIRFAANGWIYELYIEPEYYFTFYGFDWVTPLGDPGMYILFVVMGLAALFIMLGYHYRLAAVVFFLTFTYAELIDKTNYLNHYYFVSIIAFLLILVPANRYFSVDARKNPRFKRSSVPAWTINIFKLQLGIVYFCAGLAKLNPDWLFEAMPLKLWLPANAHLPVIGGLLEHAATAYFFSWMGAVYDLTIVFFLLYGPTRIWAYMAVIAFHMLTWMLFPIGMFPFIMILSTLIFFPAEFHQKIIDRVRLVWRKLIDRTSDISIQPRRAENKDIYRLSSKASVVLTAVLVLHFSLQILLPFRFALYPGDLFWTEQGYRFSWRVMLMEKAGYTTFHVRDPHANRMWEVAGWEYLTPNQEKMMSTQPDMILQFAHFLEKQYREQGMEDVEIRAESYVTLNGRRSQLMVDPEVDLTKEQRGFAHKDWILPYNRNEESWMGKR